MRRERYTIKHYKTKFKIYYKIRLIKANEYNIYIYIYRDIYIYIIQNTMVGGGEKMIAWEKNKKKDMTSKEHTKCQCKFSKGKWSRTFTKKTFVLKESKSFLDHLLDFHLATTLILN